MKGGDSVEIKFQVSGMTCAACSARVEKVTTQLDGVNRTEVNLLAGTMVVDASEPAVQERIISAVRDAGYDAKPFGQKVILCLRID